MKGTKALLGISILGCLASCGISKPVEIQVVSPIYVMDTTVVVTFYNVDNYMDYYKEIKKIYTGVDLVSSCFLSGGDKTSIYDLNEKREADVDDSLLELLKLSLEVYEETDGYFNPYIGGLSLLWKDAIEHQEIPSASQIEDELSKMNSTTLEIEGYHVRLVGSGSLDLGGIAKGYATELARQYLAKENVNSYAIDAGNSSIALGTKNGDAFTIGLSKATSEGYYKSITGMNTTISSSSPKYQYFLKDEKKYHHLISPFTGYPVNDYDSVFLISQDSAKGDAYSTALFSMDMDTAKAFLEKEGLEAIFAKNDQILYDGGTQS